MKKLALIVSLSLATMPVFAFTAAAPAYATYCTPEAYTPAYDVTKVTNGPVVTNAYNWVLAPGGSKSESETITKSVSVTASVEYHATASVGAQGVIARASVETGIKLQAAGTVIGGSSFTKTITVTNTTSANREYVYYRGTMKYTGSYTRKTCSYDTRQIVTQTGTWTSWTVPYEGTIRCDLAAPNQVSQKAKDLYCG